MNLRRLTCAALALPLAACSEPTVSDKGVEVTLTVDRTVLRLVHASQVNVVAVNRSARSVTINSGACPAAFVVVDQNGTAITPAPVTCAAVAVTRELAPGEAFAFRHAWGLDVAGGTRALDVAGGQGPARPLAPGAYTLRGRVVGAYLKAESSPVAIRVEASSAGR